MPHNQTESKHKQMGVLQRLAAFVIATTYAYNVEMKSLKQSLFICLFFLRKASAVIPDVFSITIYAIGLRFAVTLLKGLKH